MHALEVGADVGGVLIAEIAILLQRLMNDALEVRRKIGIQPQRRDRLSIEDGIENFSGALAAEGKLPGCHFVQHRAK